MLAHTGGAAALDVPTWLLAYGAAAVVLVVTAGLRGRLVVDAARWDRGEPDRTADDHVPGGGRHAPGAARVGRVVGRVLGLGALGLMVAAALVGPEASAANLAPSTVLVVWWVGLPLACAVAGDVMAWLDPFGTLTSAASRALGRVGTAPAARVTALTAAAFLGVFTWWALAYDDGRDPRSLGWFLVAYAAAATAGGVVWGAHWVRSGEGFGALSSGLAAIRRAGGGSGPASAVVGAVVAVWFGGLAFDLFSGTRAWVDLAGATSGWARTGRATACLVLAVAGAGAVVAATVVSARRRAPDAEARAPVDRAVTEAWLATTAGAVVAHGLTLVLVDGQFAIALVSDPFGRGWNLFGTADRAIDYSPLSPGTVGVAQIALAIAGATWGVVAAARILAAGRSTGLDSRGALAALWATGIAAAGTVAAVVALLSSDLE
jgi:hypothetical protein